MSPKILKRNTKNSSLVKKASEYRGSIAWHKREMSRMWESQKEGTDIVGMKEEKIVVEK